MITSNICVDDCLVNGIISQLKFIAYKNEYNEQEIDVQNNNLDHNYTASATQPQQGADIYRWWLEFTDESVGKMARMKAKPFVLSRFQENLSHALKWIPIIKAKRSIPLSKTARCKRLQFHLVPVAALTVHKSQGATCDKIVFDYTKGQNNQLLYVAISRVTSLDGLYLTNQNDNFQFHHAAGSTTPTVKDEYLRLQQHKLPTITNRALNFVTQNFEVEPQNITITITTILGVINAQSLVAHSKYIETAQILNKCDYLALTETWMGPEFQVNVKGFEIVSVRKSNSDLSTAASTSRAAIVRQRRAGGVAIHGTKIIS